MTPKNDREQTRALTAAASRFVTAATPRRVGGDSRQTQAWSYWDDDTPEVGFGATWIGNQMGRARLYAGFRANDGSVEPFPPDHPASQLVASIGGGPDGQAAMLAEFGPHLVVAGEGWIIVEFHPTERWHVVSTEEISAKSGGLQVVLGDRTTLIPPYDPRAEVDENDTTPLAVRVWQPHPRTHIKADSPIMRSFALLDELRLLNAAVAAVAKSRLTGRGILFVPQGTRFPSTPGGADSAGDSDLVNTLIDVASTAYKQPESAAATVPIVLEVPQETIEAIHHQTFESDFDTLAVTLREETIRRFASALDTPAEVLLGNSAVNHWGVWAVEESAVRVAIEPRLALVANALTGQWLRPALQSMPDVDQETAETAVVWYDASDLRVRTNRSQTALEMYDRGEINGQALRREVGFDDSDTPTEDEKQRNLIIQMVTQAPSLAAQLLPLVGIDIAADMYPSMGGEPSSGYIPPSPVSIPVDEDASPPSGDNYGIEDEGLFASCDGLVYRALERAGQRLRSRQPRCDRGDLESLEAAAMHQEVEVTPECIDEMSLLAGAWDRASVLADRYDCEPNELEQTLDDFVRSLLVAGTPYVPDDLRISLAGGRVRAGVEA